MSSVITVLREQLSSVYLIKRLSLFQLKISNNANYLGMLWEIINPIIQIAVYWFVFGFGIRGNQQINEVIPVDYIHWMLAGIIIWFFFYSAVIDASKSIHSRLNIVSKMNFPMSVIPSFVIISKFYTHLLLVGLTLIVFAFTGYPISLSIIQLPYYLFSTVALIFSFSLISSTLTTIIRDVQMLIPSIMRILFYISPVLWFRDFSATHHPMIAVILKLNPLYYLARGYRSAFLYNDWFFIEQWKYTLYFWGLVLAMLIIGSALHIKFRSRFVDYL